MSSTPKVLLKRSSVIGKVPVAGDLQYGELAINFADGRIYYKDANDTVKNFVDSSIIQDIVKSISTDSAEVINLIQVHSLDSSEIISLIDSGYVQVRQDYAYSSLTGAPNIQGMIDSEVNVLLGGAPGALDTLSELAAAIGDDPNFITTINAAVAAQLDSSEVIALVDSAYIQQRQDYAYSSLTGAPTQLSGFTNDANYLDSNTIAGVADSAYVQLRQTQQDFAYASLTGAPNVLDSADVANIITKPFVDALNVDADTLDGQTGSWYIDYDNFTNTPVILDNVDVDIQIDNRVTKSFVDALNIDADTLDGYHAQFFIDKIDSNTSRMLDSSEAIGIFNANFAAKTTDDLTEGSNLYYTKARADSDIAASLNDSGNSVNITINNTITDTVDSDYVLARVLEAPFLDSSSVQPLLPKFGTDYIDSQTVLDIITSEGLDSDLVIALVDSAYIALRDRFQDSSLVTSTVDATYVQARQDYAYSSLTSAPNILDSANVSSIIIADVTQSYVTSLNVDADLLDGATGTFYLDYNNFTNTPSAGLSNVVEDTTPQLGGALDGNGNDIFLDDDDLFAWGASPGRTNIQGKASTSYSSNYVKVNVRSGTSQSSEIARFTEDDGVYTTIGLNLPNWNTALNNYYDLKIKGPTSNSLSANETIRFPESSGTVALTKDLIDSADIINLIDSAYIRLHTRIGDSDIDFGSNKILYSNVYSTEGDLPSASNYHGMFAHVHGTGAGYFAHAGNWVRLANQSELSSYGNSDVTSLVDSAYVQLRQSEATNIDSIGAIGNVNAIGATEGQILKFDSASQKFILSSDATGGGGGGGTVDSADIIAIVDSAYVQARQTSASGETAAELTQTTYNFTADSGQSSFTGLDVDSGKFQVYLNGLLLPKSDFTHNTSKIDLLVSADSGDVLEVIKFSGNSVERSAAEFQQRHYIYTATSGQTVFTGSDDNSEILSYTQGRINVYLNGLLLLDSADYTQNGAGTTVTFTSGVTVGHVVDIQILSGNTGTFAPLEQTLYEFTADSGQTVFTGSDDNSQTLSFSDDKITVFLNGILLSSGDYFESNGNKITLGVGTDSGNLLTVAKLSGNNIGLDSESVTQLIDSAYVAARSGGGGGGGGGTDSATVLSLINDYIIDVDSALTTTTADQVVDTFAAATYRTAKYIIQMSHSSGYHSNEVLLVHDGSSVYMTTYAEVITAASLGTIDADINGGNVRLLVTPTNTNTDINLTRINIDV